MKFDRYKQNLYATNDAVYSYNTKVAEIRGNYLVVLPEYEKYSVTTSKHINYAASMLGLVRVSQAEWEQRDALDHLFVSRNKELKNNDKNK